MKLYSLVMYIAVVLTFWGADETIAEDAKLGEEVEVIKPFEANNWTQTKYDFNVPSFGIEHQVRLSMEVCAPYEKYKAGSGSHPALVITVNGNSIDEKQLLNKAPNFNYMGHQDLTWNRNSRWRVLYAQNYEMVKAYTTQYPNDQNPYKYVFDITRFVEPGNNQIVFDYSHAFKTIKLKVRNIKLVVDRTFIVPKISKKVIPPPTGELPVMKVRGTTNEPFEVFLSDSGTISVKINGNEYFFNTRTTIPGGGWKNTAVIPKGKYVAKHKSESTFWKTAYYTINRKIDVKDDHIVVSDRITNNSSELLGMYYENFTVCENASSFYLGGIKVEGNASMGEYENPSAIVVTPKISLGMVPESDIFQAHINLFRSGNKIGLQDRNLGIPSGQSVTMQWSIYPVAAGDYWDTINAIRRNWRVNRTIPGPLAFRNFSRLRTTDAENLEWIKKRGLVMAIDSIAIYNRDMIIKLAEKYGDKGRFTKYAHGTAAVSGKATDFLKRLMQIDRYFKQNMPDFEFFCYFHAQICSLEEGPELYDDSIARDASGDYCYYSSRCLKIYVPTQDSKYGKALWEYVELIVDEDKLDMNMYWDEESFSIHRFVYNDNTWDGNSVILNPNTFEVSRKVTCVPLATQPLKLEICKYVESKGKLMIANSQAATPSMRKENILRFNETGSYGNVLKSNLGCIIGLATHSFENDSTDTFNQFYQILMRGGIRYAVWSIPDDKIPEDYFPHYMFPLTPVEIGSGVIFGKERIITSRPGIYSFPGNTKAKKVVTINDKGLVEKLNKYVKEVRTVDGWKYELRNPSNCIIVLIK